MAWYQTGSKPFPEPMMTQVYANFGVTQGDKVLNKCVISVGCFKHKLVTTLKGKYNEMNIKNSLHDTDIYFLRCMQLSDVIYTERNFISMTHNYKC